MSSPVVPIKEREKKPDARALRRDGENNENVASAVPAAAAAAVLVFACAFVYTTRNAVRAYSY